MKLLRIKELYQNMGSKYFIFRLTYEIKRKAGLLKCNYPVSYTLNTFITLSEWKKNKSLFFFESKDDIKVTKIKDESLRLDFKNILKGKYRFFSSKIYNVEKDYDWVTNPETRYKYDITKHWTEVEDIVKNIGDIKYIWELSRFSFLYTIIRYDFHFEENHSSYVFQQITNWIDKNPLNCGPNYKCSQEISLRILNWIFALYYYKDSSALTEDVFQKILNSIYWQICHVYSNINFSRIAVRNNHAITETLSLYIIGLLFPFFPESKIWKRKGKKWFEEEIKYQIAEDGTYLQFSMNYHRVVVQLLTWAIILSDINNEKFDELVYDRAYQSLNFLFQCQENTNGYLPNYGANDGALFFKLNNNDYRDYRPQLDVLHYILTGSTLYKKHLEDKYWYASPPTQVKRSIFPPLKEQYGLISFIKGGYYLIKEQDTLTFIRCGKYKDRPSHADNLHVDIWYRGENVLLDGGSYKYNAEYNLIKYFSGTESHNTIMLDDMDQMLKGPRFIWYSWSQAIENYLLEDEKAYKYTGVIECYKYIDKNVKHNRSLIKIKGRPEWIIKDVIINKPKGMKMRQLWHTRSSNLTFKSDQGIFKKSIGMYSSYYGEIEESNQIEIVSDTNTIETHLQIV